MTNQEQYEEMCEIWERFRWIPIDDRLPTESGWYLCSTLTPIGYIVTEHKFDLLNGRFHENGIAYNVDAWMPLPEPYKR